MFSLRLWMAVSMLALAVGSTSRADNPRTSATTSAPQSLTCQIYSLADLSDDAQFGAWVAKTIPEVIDPKSWNMEDAAGKRVLTYNAAGRVMVVYQTPKVHQAIASFLTNVKQTMPAQARTWAKATSVVQAAHTIPAPAKFADPAALPSAVASTRTTAERPPHLFHIIVEGLEGKGATYKLKNFTIRYEGDGVIDANVVEMIRLQTEAAKDAAIRAPKGNDSEDPAMPSALQQLMGLLPFQACEMKMPAATGVCQPACAPGVVCPSPIGSNILPTAGSVISEPASTPPSMLRLVPLRCADDNELPGLPPPHPISPRPTSRPVPATTLPASTDPVLPPLAPETLGLPTSKRSY